MSALLTCRGSSGRHSTPCPGRRDPRSSSPCRRSRQTDPHRTDPRRAGPAVAYRRRSTRADRQVRRLRGRTQWAGAGAAAPAAGRRGTAIINLSVNLRLRTIEDFFTAPSLDPLSDWFEVYSLTSVSYTHLRAHETRHDLVCRLLLEKKKKTKNNQQK